MTKSNSTSTGYVAFKIATHLTKADKADFLSRVMEPEEWANLTEAERLNFLSRVMDPDEWVDHILAKKEATKVSRKATHRKTLPKWLRPYCGATTKTRKGGTCRATPVWDKAINRPVNGRCRMHGGNSKGAVTLEGKRRSWSKLKNSEKWLDKRMELERLKGE